MKIINKVLNEASQNKLNLEFEDYIVRIEYDDYNYTEWKLKSINEKELNDKIQKLKNSSDYYNVSIYLRYNILDNNMEQFIDKNNMYYETNSNLSENMFISLFSEYELLNNSKPKEDILYEEAGSIFSSVCNVNGDYDKEQLIELIQKLKELEDIL